MTLKSVTRVLAVMLAFVGISGCYLPVYFDAEVELDRTGYYTMIFDGYMTRVQLFKDLKEGKIDRAEEMRQVERIKTDFERDSSTTEFKYHKDGVFKVHWEKSGDMLRAKSVTFFRRNENILSLRYLKEQGVIILEGAAISTSNAKRLKEIGLAGMEGQLRVKTTAAIRAHNAAKEKKGKEPRQKVLVWNLRSVYDPKPYLMVNMR